MQSARNQIFEPPACHFPLASSNWNRGSGAKLRVTSRVILRERLLQPTDAELLQQPGPLQRRLKSKGLSRVDHYIPGIAGGLARCLHMGKILRQVLTEWPPAELYRGEPEVDRLSCEFACFLWRRTEQVACVSPYAIATPISQQLIQRLPCRFCGKIPERQVGAADCVNHGATSTVSIGVVVQTLPERFHVERVLPAQQIGESMPAFGRTRRFEDRLTHIGLAADFADSHEAGVSVNADDENVLGTVGYFIDLRQPKV